MKKVKPYEKEFKIRAVKMLRESGKTMRDIARELGCSATALADWKRKYDDPLKNCLAPDKVTPEELRKENQRLQKELNLAIEQREILKKCAAILGQ